jgi:hypothetical protein
MRFALVDGTGGATTTLGMAVTTAVLEDIANACTVQLNRDVSAEWGGNYEVRAAVGAGDIQPGEIVFALLPSLPDAPGAIAYHDVNGVGVPVIYDAITLSDSLTGSGNSLSVAVSHELCETAGDESVNAWRDDGAGSEWAQELCDAVEAQSYLIGDVAVSNFLLKAFFTPNHVGPYDYMSSAGLPGAVGPTGPFATPSGGNYQIVRSSGAGEHQVQARHTDFSPTVTVSVTVPFAHTRADKRLAKRRHPSSRTYRRGVRL